MSLEESKEKIRVAFLESFNEGKYDKFQALFSPDAFSGDRAKSQNVQGPEGAKELVENFRKAFPDIKVVIEEQIAQGDKVATLWSMTGTHQGEFLGKAPTGKPVSITACSVDQVANGKVIKYTTWRDDLSLMKQIGAI